ncbi:MAG: L-glutamate gamma-semialdehyde dehydrogenase [Sphingobacteriia bacterium]|nr:L-glutamate gamma-semialdehyde dehydrogenase [Sphingobacteriia bacterium]
MANAFYRVPQAHNEPILGYAPNSPERKELQLELEELRSKEIEIPMYIGDKRVATSKKISIHPPHDHKHVLGYYYEGNATHVTAAIEAALEAKSKWANLPWQDRAAIFLKAADLLSGPWRARMNAATMLCQSKNAFQAEIDAVCELADFFRFNVQYMTEIYQQQPESPALTWNRMEHRPLEGFVFALTPFNFTSIAGNLPCAPAMMGNTIVWKPANSQIYSAQVIMEILLCAGLPAGVINLVYAEGPVVGEVIFKHRDFAGIHFTGSTGVFQNIWKTIGENISTYKSYPRIVGETGGKDFVLAHPSADPVSLSVALARGAFEFQGQKCSAASRAYIPTSLWPKVKELLIQDISTFKIGGSEDFGNFINAVIDLRAFDKISGYIDKVKQSSDAEIIIGGGYDKTKGYFIEPTVVVTTNPHFFTLEEEIFGPVLTLFIYEDKDWQQTLRLVDETSPYALTGAIFAKDRYVIQEATEALQHAAGNFYINDKPTGAVVGQQPFGGARASGTNDKAGSVLNLLRWVSPRVIKENFVPPVNYRYPFLG